MKVIEQKPTSDLKYDTLMGRLVVHQLDHCIVINTQGAKKLIEVLKEYVDENKD